MNEVIRAQVRLSKFVVDPITAVQTAIFLYVQRFLEIMFVGIVLSCCLTTFLPTFEKRNAVVQRLSGGGVGSNVRLMGKQVNSIVVNMQRTFADTVSSIIPDVQTRRMVVMLGLCMLPSIASVVSGDANAISVRSIESFFLMAGGGNKKRAASLDKEDAVWSSYAKILAKIWITGLSMAWINTALGFIIPSADPSSQSDALDVWISLVSTVSLAILTRSLHPLFPGLLVFQGYIEWSVASGALNYLATSKRASHVTSMLIVICAGLAFYCVDALQRDLQRAEDGRMMMMIHRQLGGQPPNNAPRLSFTLHTLQSVTIIFFTNSLVSFSMEIMSPGGDGSSSSSSATNIAANLATVVTGLIVAKTVMQLVEAYAADSRK